jgi:hypothetical protein
MRPFSYQDEASLALDVIGSSDLGCVLAFDSAGKKALFSENCQLP